MYMSQDTPCNMSSPAFVSGLPTFFESLKGRSVHHHHNSQNRCPLRASAETPSRPEDFEDESKDSIAKSRAMLEQALGLGMKPSEGKNGQCECIWCNGTRERRCSWCDGKGYRYELAHKSWEELSTDIERMHATGEPQFMPEPQKVPVQCSACSGSKKLRCAYCRGSGIGSYGHAH